MTEVAHGPANYVKQRNQARAKTKDWRLKTEAWGLKTQDQVGAHDSQRHQDKAHDIRRQEATRACSIQRLFSQEEVAPSPIVSVTATAVDQAK